MDRTGFAYFVESPRIIEDLLAPHPIEQETQYEIVKTVKLAKIDYENFITDMIADRQFITRTAARPLKRRPCNACDRLLCRLGSILLWYLNVRAFLGSCHGSFHFGKDQMNNK